MILSSHSTGSVTGAIILVQPGGGYHGQGHTGFDRQGSIAPRRVGALAAPNSASFGESQEAPSRRRSFVELRRISEAPSRR
ncbi:MAG: hypothetical protein MZU97_19010 [Bacillus subtilis]|nr:hypothetical protein [Bacillus subtilis]